MRVWIQLFFYLCAWEDVGEERFALSRWMSLWCVGGFSVYMHTHTHVCQVCWSKGFFPPCIQIVFCFLKNEIVLNQSPFYSLSQQTVLGVPPHNCKHTHLCTHTITEHSYDTPSLCILNFKCSPYAPISYFCVRSAYTWVFCVLFLSVLYACVRACMCVCGCGCVCAWTVRSGVSSSANDLPVAQTSASWAERGRNVEEGWRKGGMEKRTVPYQHNHHCCHH